MTVGLGFTQHDIGISLSCMGGVLLACQLIVYPYLARTMTHGTILKTVAPGFVIAFACCPLISQFVAQYGPVWTWATLLVVLSLRQACCVMVFTAVNIIICNTAKPGQLGRVNGIGQASSSFVRGVGPALGGILWAWSTQSGLPFPLDNVFIFVFLCLVSGAAAVQAWLSL
jgi:hypothetical protein